MHNYHLLSLLQLTDPTLPVGGFSHSAGLETYVQAGVVRDAETAKSFVTQMLSQNIKYTDAAFVSLAYDAAINNNVQQLTDLDNECSAVKLPREMRQASQKLGLRLLKIFSAIHPNAIVDDYLHAIKTKDASAHYCIAFGLYAAVLHIPKADALSGFYYNAAVGMVTNSVKLVPLGQQDGQLILFSLQSLLSKLVEETMEPDREMIGVCCTGFDIRSMQHEQLYSRLYMS